MLEWNNLTVNKKSNKSQIDCNNQIINITNYVTVGKKSMLVAGHFKNLAGHTCNINESQNKF